MTLLSLCSRSILPRNVVINERNDRGRRPARHAYFHKKLVLPQPTYVRLFPQYRRDCALLCRPALHVVSATETEVAVEETDSPVIVEDSGEQPSVEANGNETTETSSPTRGVKRSKPARKSEMPPVTNEELIPGAVFNGKVRSIQPFGAFIDFGAFTDGLVHVSRLSDSYVKDVANVVSIGQEVKVRLVEVNMETGRISLSMRENDAPNRSQVRKETPSSPSRDKPKPVRKDQPKTQRRVESKSSKYSVGQELKGTVKNKVRAGSFITLGEGEEGFLPLAEESGDGYSEMMGESSLEAGQEVTVRVLRFSRGQVTLTMKTEDDENSKTERELTTEGVVHKATNPFFLAFRGNKEIAAFLDEREKEKKSSAVPEKPQISSLSEIADSISLEETSNQNEMEATTISETSQIASSDEVSLEQISSAETENQNDVSVQNNLEQVITDEVETSIISETSQVSISDEVSGSSSSTVEEASLEQISSAETENQNVVSVQNNLEQMIPDEVETSIISETSQVSISDEVSGSSSTVDEASLEQISSAETENQNAVSVQNNLEQATPDEVETSIISETSDENENLNSVSVQNELEHVASDETSQISTTPEVSSNSSLEEISTPDNENQDAVSSQNEIGQIPSDEPNNSIVSETQPDVVASLSSKASIAPALVKQLREESGAGMMDCKKALAEAEGDIVKAQELLRTKGLAGAEKKASRLTTEGRIGSYIHDNRIGVLIEVNCETDFVSRGEIFKELVDDLAMQVAACPQVEVLVPEDVPEETISREKAIEMQKEDLLSKPEQIRSKIVEGRIKKRLDEVSLMEQAYIKDDKVIVKDLIKQTIMAVGENIKVKRFIRYNLGEGLEKKSQDFAAEVAAQTAAKQDLPPPSQKEVPTQASSVAVSAALVKQLREETGAGMMDCKKALSETGGDLEKAQEYLRKKGLSAADKKSSRLAAEGRIGTYIHDTRIGVLIEVNCETDFVGRSENFKQLVDDLAMQVVACPQVEFISIEEIPETVINEEKEVQRKREDIQSKPENMREKIVEGRVSKVLGERALLEQAFIKDDSILVKDLVKQTIAALGENIKIRRFQRFTLGEAV